jgi:uncharacterized protein (DUF1501 family)
MQKSNLNLITRRGFLDAGFKSGLAVALSTLVDIPLVMKRALAEGSIGLNGKKLLFIWLRGANDGLNSIIPIQDSAYASARPTLAIPKDAGTNYASVGGCDFPVSGTDSIYGSYPFAVRLGNGFAALHPSLKFLAPAYNAGDLSLIHRVAYPRQSRSHFDSQRYWENGLPSNNVSSEGIFYRTMVESGLANSAPLTGVSIQSSLPMILRGSAAAMTNLTDPNRYDLLGVPNNTAGNRKATNSLFTANGYPFPAKLNRDLLQLQYSNMEKTLGVFAGINFTEAGNTFRDNEITDGDTEWAALNGGEGYYLFPTTNVKNGGWRRDPNLPSEDDNIRGDKYVVNPTEQGFFANLKAAALVLNKTDAIVAGTEIGGFDTHQGQGQLNGQHPNLNRAIGWSIYALRKYFTRYFDKVTWDNLVVVTLTEFGRTTVENADLGTDHAEAGVMWVAGGGVRGYDAGAGRSGVFNCGSAGDPIVWNTGTSGAMYGVTGRYLSRACDYRQVLGELIRDHLGATQSQVNRIIPGYANPSERLLSGGTSIDGVQIRGELGLV